MPMAAHRFLTEVARDAELRARLAELGPDPDLEALAELARAAGFAVAPGELRAAWRQDWALRALAAGGKGGGGGMRE